MRILKRNLAFMLAMIMALSLTAFAGYEDYPDVDELTYVEAVDVLTELGIVEGSNGQLLPTGNLTRAQAAKLIAYTMLGKKAADALQADTATFVDVPTYHWAAGYVEYCANEGIVGGNGDGTFAPEANVTGSAFAKMLLCAVGYGQNGEFTGPTWDATVNAMATKLGVFDGNLDVVFKNAVTREEAFLYVFNALTKVMSVTYSADADEYYAGTVFDSIKGFDEDETLGAKLYDLNTRNGEDAFGREGHYWYKNNKKITDLYAVEADAVYTTEVKSKTIYADLDLDKTTQATVIENGEKVADFQLKNKLDKKLAISGNGVLVEAYLDEDMDVTLIVVDTYLAQVTDITNDEVDFTVFMKDGSEVRVADHETSMDLTEDQYVLVTMVDDEIQSIANVEEINGELDARGATSTYTEMDGTKYNHSFNLDQTNDSEVYEPSFDDEMIMMLDEYGYMIGLVKADVAENLDGYVLVTDSEVKVGGLASSDRALVEVLHLDGTGYEVYEMRTRRTKVGDDRVTQFWNPVKERNNNEYEAGWETLDADADDFIPYGFYGYTMTDDEQIVLKHLDETKAKDMDVVPGTVKANGDSQKLTFGNVTNLVMDNDTVLNMVTEDEVETFEGYKNIKIDEVVDALVIYKGRTVETLYVVDGDMLDDDIVAYYNGGESKIIDDEEYVRLYIDGEAGYYNIESADIFDIDGVTPRNLDKGAYVVEMEDGDVVSMTIVKSTWHETVVTSAKAKYFNVAGTNVTVNNVTYADGCEVYDLTDGGKLVDSVAKDDKIIFITKGDKNADVATYIWILKHNSSKADVEEDVADADVVFTKNENTWRFDFTNLKKDDVVVITAYNYAEGIDGVYATYSFTQAADGTNGYQQTYNVDAQMSFVVTINGRLVHDGPVYSFVK